MKTISFIGAGNVAWHLARGLKNRGYTIGSVWSRDPQHALDLAALTGANTAASVNDLHPGTEMVIVSVRDEVLADLVKEILFYEGIIVHTSGSLGLEIFKERFNHPGVMYPFQTFTKNIELDLGKIPFFIEAGFTPDLDIIREVAGSLSTSINVSTEFSRRIIHLAGIFAGNFPNYFYILAQNLLKDNVLDFEMVKPLIEETTRKALNNNPENVQTGPAMRNDKVIIQKHLELLKAYPGVYELYKMISEQIMEKYKMG